VLSNGARHLGVEPRPLVCLPHWASQEAIRNEHGTTRGEASV